MSISSHRLSVGARSRQQGQSLVEMAIALMVLVPLAASVMLLGQFIHIKLQTQSAAREAAWQATIDPTLAYSSLPALIVEQDRLRLHQFADAAIALQSNANVPSQFSDPMLTSFANMPLLKPKELTLAVYKQQPSPSYLDTLIGMVPSLPPNKKGLITAEVHAKTEQILGSSGNVLTFVGDWANRHLDFSAKTVLLADAWDASGSGESLNGAEAGGAYHNRSVRGVISPMVPTEWGGNGVSSMITDVATLLGNIPLIDEVLTPNFDHFEFGRAAPDVVPGDKLVNY
jgi:hypothetical protein